MKSLLLAFVCALLSVQASAAIVTIDPDDWADGADISNPVPGVRLSAPFYQVGMVSVLARTVGAAAPTGDKVFGTPATGLFVLQGGNPDNIFTAIDNCINGSVPGIPGSSICNTGGTFLVVEFDSPTDFVSISARVGSDSAILSVFGADGNQLEFVAKARNNPWDDGIVNPQIARAQRDIAYVAAWGESTGGTLDNLQFNSEVPLPAAAWLFLSALGGLVMVKRKRS